MMNVDKRQVLAYVFLPQIFPRLRDLFATGFQMIPYFMAIVYRSVGLLPGYHPYVDPANIGAFGVRHVIAVAANNLEFRRENIDQIVLFGCTVIGVVLVMLQLLLFAAVLFVGPAIAASGGMPDNFADFFVTDPDRAHQDLAFMMMDLVFGVPEMFNSCVSTAATCLDSTGQAMGTQDKDWILEGLGWPHPIHLALHQMFQLYSLGLLVVGALITIYFIATVVLETAQSGTPFGKRFNKVWAPLRLVVAFGLLVPVGYGLNSAQYIVLYAAKYGSGFASNSWTLFNENLNENYLGDARNLVSVPNTPEVDGLLQFMFVARACAEAEKLRHDAEGDFIKAYFIRDPLSSPRNMELPVPNLALGYVGSSDYETALSFINPDDDDNGFFKLSPEDSITIRFGIADEENYARFKGAVAPICGEVTIPLKDPRKPSDSENPPDAGTAHLQAFYLYVIQWLWHLEYRFDPYYAENVVRLNTQFNHDPDLEEPGPDYKRTVKENYQEWFKENIEHAIDLQVQSGRWNVPQVLKDKGWGGAGIWYNRVAELNGSLTSAIFNVPAPSKFPEVMEYVVARKQQQDRNVKLSTRFEPKLANGDDIQFQDTADSQIAKALWEAFYYWQADGHGTSNFNAPTGNAFYDYVKALFGLEGLYNIKRNPDVHPLAQLVGVGRSLVESSVRNLGIAAIGGVGAGALSTVLDVPALGQVGGTLVGFLVSITMIGLIAGFLLFYIIPFMPFIYFFFAVGGWVKSIFEALVGTPLWALSHIRIDGDGLPGQAAKDGYWLILEIFLRPILIVFGLLASISIFAAMVDILHDIWELVTVNLGGFDIRAETESGSFKSQLKFFGSAIDQFFYTVVYTVVVYIMATSSFKLIDQIPKSILRWIGSSAQGFNDTREDPAAGLMQTATVGAQQTLKSLGDGAKGALQKVAQGYHGRGG
jgi:conjugal transfer/type IV secretion protein DotA/TraY